LQVGGRRDGGRLVNVVAYDRYGPPDVLRLEERPVPTPDAGEVLVEIHAASLNAYDWHLLTADMFLVRFTTGLLRPRHQVLGADLAGRVVAVGDGVDDLEPGDEVYGDISQCGDGSLADYATAPANRLAHKPASLSFEQAAAVPMAAVTALQGLRDAGPLQPDPSVLVHGASGGVGTFAVQIAKVLGARVTAVCSTRNVDRAYALGADEVIDYTRDDVTSMDARHDVVLAVNGYHPITAYRRILTPTGAYVMIGGAPAQMFQALLLGPLLSRRAGKRMRVLTAKPGRDDLATLRAWIDAGEVTPVVDRTFDGLSTVPDALRYLGEGHARGKVVVRVKGNRSG
jgi:NADPH:quinone reductase-like Zn-dependent oxidoreductase